MKDKWRMDDKIPGNSYVQLQALNGFYELMFVFCHTLKTVLDKVRSVSI